LKNSNDFKFDITFAFAIYGFIIIVITTYASIYFFTRLTTNEFKEKIKLIASNIYSSYKEKEQTIKNTTLALSNNDIFNNSFEVNPEIIKSVFKTMLYANKHLKEISYYNKYGKNILSCIRMGNYINCGNNYTSFDVSNFQNDKALLFKEKLKKGNIEFISFAPVKIEKNPGFIKVKSFIKPFKKSDFYYLMMIDNKGNIYYSNLYHSKNLNDVFNYFLNQQILKTKEGFVTDNIYVKEFSKNLKLVFIQNRELINKTNNISKTLTLIMIIFSVLLAIPLGIFFSRPLFHFYEELDKRVNEEIRKRREKEQLLIAQSKLATLGEMLGNIAHQWRHPITRLSLLIQNFELAAKKNKLTPEFIEKFKDNATSQINYMSDTIDDFINFFRRDKKKVKFYPEEIVKSALKLIEGRIKNLIKIEIKVLDNREMEGYKSEFSQVILNILNNAIDVIKERNVKNGKIEIIIDKNTIKIKDNAGGIDENIKDKIFEPYFTTKFQSQGTGIGLYMSKIIIEQHFNGKLYAYNDKEGAVFVVDLNKSTF